MPVSKLKNNICNMWPGLPARCFRIFVLHRIYVLEYIKYIILLHRDGSWSNFGVAGWGKRRPTDLRILLYFQIVQAVEEI